MLRKNIVAASPKIEKFWNSVKSYDKTTLYIFA